LQEKPEGAILIIMKFRRMHMKISRIVITLWIAAVMVLPLAAQTESGSDSGSDEKKSEYYYVSVPVEKVFPYRKGYVVFYRKGATGMARAYLPGEWFTETGGKGDLIVLRPGSTWPGLTVYYKDGAFSHVRLYVRQERNHESWGAIPPGVNLDSYFEDAEDLKLEF
jgi:hypothetical protein